MTVRLSDQQRIKELEKTVEVLRREKVLCFIENRNLEKLMFAKNAKISELTNDKCASSLVIKSKKQKCEDQEA